MGICGSKPDKVLTPLPVKPPPSPPTPRPTPPPLTPTPPPPTTKPDVEFSSDCITKQIDERRDEHPIQSTEDDYPDPAPPHTDEDERRPKYHWFEDDDYEKGSDEVVDLHEIEATGSAEDDSGLTLQKRGRKKDVKEKKLPTISYAEIDENAKKVDPKLSFERLMSELTQPIAGADTNRELLTARAIITWLAHQDIDHVTYGAGSLDTPAGMLQLLKENKMTYATCYTRLCRKAGLQCTLVKGLVKAAAYEPGHTHAPTTHWTAVFAAGSWRLVHPFWICRAVFGHNLGGWVKIEQDGTSVEQRERASAGVVRSTFQEHYFMPRPQHFIYECYAEDTQWQLLPDDAVVRSQKDFLEMPYLLPPFFGLALELVTEHKCSLATSNGRCKIVLKAKPWNAHMLVLRYELFARSVSNEKLQKDKRASRMVFNSRANELFEFDIRFPEPGEYKFIIYGGPFKSPALRLCEFQIECKAAMKPFALLPLSCEDIGWGPGPKSVEAGLLVPTRVGGFVNVPQKKPRRADIQFQIHPDMISKNKYGASLYRQSDGENGSDEYVECQIKERCLIITVTLPSDDEFGLAITCSTMSVGGMVSETKTVCNYLLCTTNQRRTRTEVKIARDRLMKALDSDIEPLPRKVEDIRGHIENCRKKRIDELDEDFCAAKTRFEYLFYKNELRDAGLRDNYHVTVRTLERLDRYKYKAALQGETRRVQALMQTLIERRGKAQNMNTVIPR